MDIQELDNSLIKDHFKDNVPLLKSIRSLFFGMPVSEEDKGFIKALFSNEKLREAFRKQFYTKFGDQTQLEKIGDFWASTDVNSILNNLPENIAQHIQSREIAYNMLEQAMGLLTNPDGEKVDLSFEVASLKDDPYAIKFLGRNKFINTIATGLNLVNLLANTKAKSQEEVLKTLKKDSTR